MYTPKCIPVSALVICTRIPEIDQSGQKPGRSEWVTLGMAHAKLAFIVLYTLGTGRMNVIIYLPIPTPHPHRNNHMI